MTLGALESLYINTSSDDLLVILHVALDDGDNMAPEVFTAINELVERSHLGLLSPSQIESLGFYRRVAAGGF